MNSVVHTSHFQLCDALLEQGMLALREGHMQPTQMLPNGSPQRCHCLPLLPTLLPARACAPHPQPQSAAVSLIFLNLMVERGSLIEVLIYISFMSKAE